MPPQTNFIGAAFHGIQFEFDTATQQVLPVTPEELLHLCGGIPCPDITGMQVQIKATYATAFSIKIISDQYEACRNIDFSIGRIDNNFLYVQERRQGLGTNLFLNQLLAARRLGFKKIHLTAMAPVDDVQWDGYYFWANLGFENSDTQEFQEWAMAMNRQEPTLSELVQTQEGRDLWKETGFTWIGDFHVTAGSKCMEYLKRYLRRKKINFPLE